MEPRWHQIASKIDPKIDQKMINFWIAPRSIFDRFWAPTWGVQGGPWGSVGRLFGLLKLSWSQDEPKSSPRSPKTLPRALLEPILTILGSNLMVFIPNLNDFRPPTWWILQPTNQPNSQSTNQPNNQPTKPYIQTSLHPQARGRVGRRQLDMQT